MEENLRDENKNAKSKGMEKTLYVGIDLAWKIGNPFFVSLIEEVEKGKGRIIEVKKKTHSEVVEYLEKKIKNYKKILAAIDGPLIVKNRIGARKCEKELAKAYRKFKASPHPTNLKKKYVNKLVRVFIPLFIRKGYSITSDVSLFKNKIKKLLIEIYPHPAMVEIFGLKERLKYKKGNKEERREGLKKLINLLIVLKRKTPQLNGVEQTIEKSLKVNPLDNYRRLKEFEDFLDAIFCGYISFYIGYWLNQGKMKWKVFGNAPEGFIIVPTLKSY